MIGYMEVLVAKTLIDIDEGALAQAQRSLGTTTKKDTVNQALASVAALSARRRDLARFGHDDHADLRDADVMSGAWQR
jgi:Arc/MetJ family transcription regulator